MNGEFPKKFGKYLLLEKLSSGGMAEVYRAKAFGVEGFEKSFAIKKILPHLSEDPDFIAMFIDEAKIAARLHHANICQVVEFGRVGRTYYLAMEYIAGADLRRISKKFREQNRLLPTAFSLYTIERVLDALDYAHRKTDVTGQPLNIVHRDVSPQNVLVSFEGEVKLIDFGIAKAAHRSVKTQAGQIKGKFGYLSPEQIMGRPLDGRSDIFAAGTVLWELLAGRDLFTGETDLDVLRAIIRLDIPPLTQVNPSIPPELERIVARALQRSPEDRYPTAGDFMEELQHFAFQHGLHWGSSDVRDFMAREFAEELAQEREKVRLYWDLSHEVRLPEGTVEQPPEERPKTVVTFSGKRLIPSVEAEEEAFEDSEMTVVLGFSESDSQVSQQFPRPQEPEPGFLAMVAEDGEEILELDEQDLEIVEEELDGLAQAAEEDWELGIEPAPDRSFGVPFSPEAELGSSTPDEPAPIRLETAEVAAPPPREEWPYEGEPVEEQWDDETPTQIDWQALAEPFPQTPEPETEGTGGFAGPGERVSPGQVEEPMELDSSLLEEIQELEEVADEGATVYDPGLGPLKPIYDDEPSAQNQDQEEEPDEGATVYDPGLGPLKPIYDDSDPTDG